MEKASLIFLFRKRNNKKSKGDSTAPKVENFEAL